MNERHHHDGDAVSDALGDDVSDTLAGADLDTLGVNRIIVGPRRIEHLPGRDLDAPRADLGAGDVLDPGDHYYSGLSDADRRALDAIYRRADDRAGARRRLVRRIKRGALLQRLAARRAGGDRVGPGAAVAGRRAAVDASTASLVGRHMSPRREPLPWWA